MNNRPSGSIFVRPIRTPISSYSIAVAAIFVLTGCDVPSATSPMLMADHIRAKNIQIVDDEGNTRIELGMMPISELGADQERLTRVAYPTSLEYSPVIRLGHGDSETVMVITANHSDGLPKITLRNRQGEWVSSWTASADDFGQMMFKYGEADVAFPTIPPYTNYAVPDSPVIYDFNRAAKKLRRDSRDSTIHAIGFSQANSALLMWFADHLGNWPDQKHPILFRELPNIGKVTNGADQIFDNLYYAGVPNGYLLWYKLPNARFNVYSSSNGGVAYNTRVLPRIEQ